MPLASLFLLEKDGETVEEKKISVSLHENESYIRKRCENCDDILIRPMRLGEGHKVDCLMVYIEVAVSNMMLDDSAIGKMINHFWEIPEEKIREFIRRNSLGIADVEELFSMEEVFGAVLSGNAVFFMDGYDRAMKISSKGYPGLDVSEAETEKVLRGSKEGFCDSVKTNAALVRKRIRDTRLKVEQQSIGVRSNTCRSWPTSCPRWSAGRCRRRSGARRTSDRSERTAGIFYCGRNSG